MVTLPLAHFVTIVHLVYNFTPLRTGLSRLSVLPSLIRLACTCNPSPATLHKNWTPSDTGCGKASCPYQERQSKKVLYGLRERLVVHDELQQPRGPLLHKGVEDKLHVAIRVLQPHLDCVSKVRHTAMCTAFCTAHA
jgi:hypothetical protein